MSHEIHITKATSFDVVQPHGQNMLFRTAALLYWQVRLQALWGHRVRDENAYSQTAKCVNIGQHGPGFEGLLGCRFSRPHSVPRKGQARYQNHTFPVPIQLQILTAELRRVIYGASRRVELLRLEEKVFRKLPLTQIVPGYELKWNVFVKELVSFDQGGGVLLCLRNLAALLLTRCRSLLLVHNLA